MSSEHKNPRSRTFPSKTVVTQPVEPPTPPQPYKRTQTETCNPVSVTQLRFGIPQRLFPLKTKTITEHVIPPDCEVIIPEKPHEPQKRAIVIGINYYNTDKELTGCRDDAGAMYSFLVSSGYSEIEFLYDDPKDPNFNNYSCPTKGRILSKISEFASKTKATDTLFIYYAGKNEKELFSVVDTFITFDEMNEVLFKPFPEGAYLRMVFDGNFDKNIINFENSKNIILINGYLDKSVNTDVLINGRFHGAVTWAFMVSLQKLLIFDGVFKKWNWYDLLYQMRFQLISNGFSQMPKLSSTNINYLDENIRI